MVAAQMENESPYAWARLLASLALMTVGGVGMYGVSVVLPAVQVEFAATRSEASLPYALTPMEKVVAPLADVVSGVSPSRRHPDVGESRNRL